MKRVEDCYDTMFFEDELGVVPFQAFHGDMPAPELESLPAGPWKKDSLPLIKEEDALNYLKRKGGYTKNYRTGVRLCQCGHLYDIEVANKGGTFYVQAKCRPAMRKTPPFYVLFVEVQDQQPIGGNCFCAAGASQSCVHISVLLLKLAEITPQACTSVRCAWSRPSVGGSASLTKDLDFGQASLEGYFPYSGPKPNLCSLLEDLDAAGSKPGIIDYLQGEQERVAMASDPVTHKTILKDAVDKLSAIAVSRDPTVDDLVQSLSMTDEEAELIQIMTIGQRNNPLWMDARQWRITASNFGRVCNRNFRVLYPPSLAKIVLGDYGRPNSSAIQWGCDNEEKAVKAYEVKSNAEIDVCGLFLSTQFPFLGASPDGIMYVGEGKFALIEVKCPYIHRSHSIRDACQDTKLCLAIENGRFTLKKNHDYYYQIMGQLAIAGAEFCDFVVWTLEDMHIERIYLNKDIWQDMLDKLQKYYYTTLGPEIIHRLLEM